MHNTKEILSKKVLSYLKQLKSFSLTLPGDGSRDKGRSLGSSSETASSSSSSLGYSKAQAAPRAPPYAPDVYDATTDGPYNMDCDRGEHTEVGNEHSL